MIKDDYNDLYWFYQKSNLTNKKGEKSHRMIRLFEEVLKLQIKKMKYNGQSKMEFDKNYRRIADIVEKAEDINKQIYLAKTQSSKIKDEWKAINRAMAAKEMGHEHLFEVFFRRAYELGSVGMQEYRDYQLKKLGI